jgi:protein-tyrosine phosphatase
MALASPMNFRDLGGKIAAGGRRVRRGQLFRTGGLSNLDADGASRLVERHGLKIYCDMRVDKEIAREGQPNGLLLSGVSWRRMPIDSFDPRFGAEGHPSSAHWTDLYIRFFDRFRPTFADLLRAAAEATGPLAFGCAAGKDRTGVAAAVILGCLGVNEAQILADYAQTTADIKPHVERFARYWSKPGRTREAFIEHYLSAPEEILRGFLDEVTRRWGSAEAALREAGLEPHVVEALRERYLDDLDDLDA